MDIELGELDPIASQKEKALTQELEKHQKRADDIVGEREKVENLSKARRIKPYSCGDRARHNGAPQEQEEGDSVSQAVAERPSKRRCKLISLKKHSASQETLMKDL
jgi:hypothetical protein